MMGVQSGLKNMFNRKITLQPNQEKDLVSFVKLRRNMLKLGALVEVPEKYNFAILHYNTVCDIFLSGSHKIDQVSAPYLFKYCRNQITNRGLFTPTKVVADVYYINLNEFHNCSFITPNYILTYGQQGRVKIKLEGTCCVRVSDSRKFMTYFCKEYAVLKSKKVMKDISFYIGTEIEKSFGKAELILSDYLGYKDKIVEIIMMRMPKVEKYLGIKINEMFISRVVVPRKYMLSKGFIQDSKDANESNEELFKMVEERLNNLQSDLSVVYSGPGKDSSENNKETNSFDDFYRQTPNESESIFISDSKVENVKTQKTDDDIINNFNIFKSGEQQAPNIISGNETKQDVKTTIEVEKVKKEVKAEKQKETVTDKVELIVCDCCGAKNKKGDEYCCVCKSKL